MILYLKRLELESVLTTSLPSLNDNIDLYVIEVYALD